MRIALEAGANAVLEKPVGRTMLLQTIENLLSV
jgi:CheY-like chemotaxis protein